MSLTDVASERIARDLEPVLSLSDPRTKLSAYHDMPYAIFRYDPDEEFELRKQVTLLETRLSQRGKRIKRISLAECLDEAMRSQRPLEEYRRLKELSTAKLPGPRSSCPCHAARAQRGCSYVLQEE